MSIETFQQFAVLFGAFALNIALIWCLIRDPRDQEETTTAVDD